MSILSYIKISGDSSIGMGFGGSRDNMIKECKESVEKLTFGARADVIDKQRLHGKECCSHL